jgi:Type ISP C-terminal specificity domain
MIMPGSGKVTERPWTDVERDALTEMASRHKLEPDELLALVGATAIDVQMNGTAKWEGVPANVWNYTLGGYQVLKKWLSYHEEPILGRALTGDEVLHFARNARRIAEILAMGPALDAAHTKARERAVPWVDGKPAQ